MLGNILERNMVEFGLTSQPMEYYLNEDIVRWFWDRKENNET